MKKVAESGMQHGRKEKEKKPIKVRSFIGTDEAEEEEAEAAVYSSLPPKSNKGERERD